MLPIYVEATLIQNVFAQWAIHLMFTFIVRDVCYEVEHVLFMTEC
jgi:hypothetical protein